MRLLWTAMLVLLLAGVVFGPGLVSRTPKPDETLVILSPHWDGIRAEYARGFEAYILRTKGKHVRVEWLDVGGTGEITKFIRELGRKANWGAGEGIGVDVLFGGGVFDYRNLTDEAALRKENIECPGGLLLPHNVPTAGQIPAKGAGQDLKDAQGRWYAACMSGFGIVYNRLVIEKAKLPMVEDWRTLSRPEYLGWVSCGDPVKSGSMHICVEMILQAYKWDDGWGIFARMAANAKSFNEGGASVPRDVSLGQCAAGPCLDFYAAAPIRRQGATHLEFLFPQDLSGVTADSIAVFRNAPHSELAQDFEDFVLSEEGQRLWYQKRGSEGGPQEFDLERLPVLPEIYKMDLPTFTTARPFAANAAFVFDDPKSGKRWNTVNALMRGALLDVHEDLKAAWEAVLKAGRAEDLGAALGRPPLSEAQVDALVGKKYSTAQYNALKQKWSGWSRRRFDSIRAAARSGGAVPEFESAPTEP